MKKVVNVKEEQEFIKMTETPVKRLVLSLGIPTIISMLVTAIYSMADTFFVGKLGDNATAGVGVVFSLQAIIQAIGFTLGMGGGAMISSLLGQRKEKEAQETASSAFYLALVLGILIAVFGTIFIKPLINLICTNEDALPCAIEYGFYVLLGAPVIAGSFVLNNLLRAEGKSRFAMIGLTTGGILNIFLDPLFITVFGYGVAGAAIATVISQCVSLVILLLQFLMKRSIITLNPLLISKGIKRYIDIIRLGLPSLARQGLASIASLIINRKAGYYGPDALAAISIVSKVFMMMFSIGLGIGQGYQPVCGYNYFAKKYKRVREAMIFTFLFSTVALSAVSMFVGFAAPSVIRWFTDGASESTVEIGKVALRYQCYALPFISINTIVNMTYQSTRQKFKATMLSCLRQGIFFIPLAFILPSKLGLQGIELVQAIADVFTCVVSIPFFVFILRNLRLKEDNMKVSV